MAVRFRSRHLHATLFDWIRSSLVGLGWGDSSLPGTDPVNVDVNFQTAPMTFLDFQPDDAGKPIVANTVAVTLGDEPASEDQQLGGGLRAVGYPVFIDVYGANQAIAQSIASDVRDLVDDDVYMWLKDHTASPAADTDEQIELLHDDIDVSRPAASVEAADIRRFWRVVKTTATVYYPGGN